VAGAARRAAACMKRVLFLSNGHGEDVIALRVIEALRPLLPKARISAWPMVGEGAAYARQGMATLGAANRLPSAGFATLDPQLMLRDLGAGWIGTHLRQWRGARALRGQFDLAVAVGDIIPLAAARIAHTPTAFIGCAKSAYYRSRAFRYNGIEIAMMRRCMAVFPRDSRTAEELAQKGIAVHDLGNPMMDGLTPSLDELGLEQDRPVVALLPGTRDDAEANCVDLLAFLAPAASRQPLDLVFATAPGLRMDVLRRKLAADARLKAWSVAAGQPHFRGLVATIAGPGGMRARIVEGRFADVLIAAELVVGMAGTGNEQAVGLGLPLVAVPSAGMQGERFVRMKAEYFGEAALTLPRDAGIISAAVHDLLNDPARRAAMGEAGRERMGRPGASRAIAARIAELVSA